MEAPSRKPILLVEDDVDIREALAETLEDLGFPIVTASHGLDALNLLLQGHVSPSVILLDLMMPVMDGYQFLDELRKHDALASIPVAIITARHVVDTARLDGLPVIQKPIKLPQLQSTLARLNA